MVTETGQRGLNKKQAAALSRWATNKPRAQSTGSERRKQLWSNLHDFVSLQNDGSRITSVPNASPAQLEVLPGSNLPDKLTEVGFQVVFRSDELRVGGPANPQYHARWRNGVRSAGDGFTSYQVFDVWLPK